MQVAFYVTKNKVCCVSAVIIEISCRHKIDGQGVTTLTNCQTSFTTTFFAPDGFNGCSLFHWDSCCPFR